MEDVGFIKYSLQKAESQRKMSLTNTEQRLENIKEEILYLSTKKSLHEENELLYGVRAKTAREYKREVIKIINRHLAEIKG